jgi:hypothetical protein
MRASQGEVATPLRGGPESGLNPRGTISLAALLEDPAGLFFELLVLRNAGARMLPPPELGVTTAVENL